MNALNTFQEDITIAKQVFEYKKKTENGMILEIHHTIPGSKGEIRRIKFFDAAFDYNEEQLVACDRKGNIFIIDLKTCQLWTLPILGKVTALAFAPNVRSVILTAIKDGKIYLRNTEDFSTIAVMEGHKEKIFQLSFDSDNFCLSISKHEAIIWDLQTYTKVHNLTLRENTTIKQAMFLPVLNDIVASFLDDVLYIWNHDTFEFSKKISNIKSSNINYLVSTKDGDTLVIGGTDMLLSYDTKTWKPMKQITLPDHLNITAMSFIPQTFDLGSNKILAILSQNHEIHTINIESNMCLQKVSTQCAIKFVCSENGKYLSCVSKTGEIHVYNVKQLFSKFKSTPIILPCDNNVQFSRSCEKKETSSTKLSRIQSNMQKKQETLKEIQNELRKTLSIKKLKPILLQFQQYPEQHRNLIWRYLLKLPNNFELFKSLVNRGVHAKYQNLEQIYPIRSIRSMRNLKTVLSALAYWCPLFSQVQYLPLFVFPFVKLFENNAIVTFEAIYTILLNYCQFWFEYYPLPPINILLIIENVLMEHSSSLLQHYYRLDITTQIYAWPLLETGFSEVLDANQWAILWDNILTNEPAFLLMAVVAYNIVQKNVIMQFSKKQSISEYFRTQNHIDMKSFISKIYGLLKCTSADNHPSSFLSDFRPLPNDTYTVFNGYPKVIVDYQADKLEKIEEEERHILEQEIEALERIKDQQNKIKESISKEEHAKRLEALEWKCKSLIENEQHKLVEKRNDMLDIKRDLRSSEQVLLEDHRRRLADDTSNRREFEMWKLREGAEQKKRRDLAEQRSTGESLHERYAKLMERQLALEERMNRFNTEAAQNKKPSLFRQDYPVDLVSLYKCEDFRNSASSLNEASSTSASSASRLKVIRNLLDEAEQELSRVLT